MASTYSSNLKIELMGTGENAGTWGNITNTNLGTALEQAVVGLGNPDFVADANLTITLTDTNAAQAARALVLNVTSGFGSLTVTRELVVPTLQKQYIVQNNTTGGQSITVKTSGGTGITVPNGRKAHLYVDGTNVIQMFDFVDINGGAIDGTVIGGAAAAAGSFTTLGASGNATVGGTLGVTGLLTATGGVSGAVTSSSVTVTGGTINGTTIGASTASTGAFTTLTSSSTTTLNGTTIPVSSTLVTTTATQTITGKTISADDNTLSGIAASSFVLSNGSGNIDGSAAQKAIPSGVVVGTTDTQTLTDKTLTSPAINTATIAGGTINNATIGATTASTGVFTQVDVDNIRLDANTVSATDTNGNLTLSPNGTGGVVLSGTNSVTVPVGTVLQRPGSPAAGMLRFNDDSDEFEGYNGTAWASVGGAALVNDTSTSTNVFPLFASATTGTAATLNTSDAKLLYKPSTGEFQATALVASNGIVVNSKTVSSSYTLAATNNAMSAGPITIDSGVTVTISSGARYVVI